MEKKFPLFFRTTVDKHFVHSGFVISSERDIFSFNAQERQFLSSIKREKIFMVMYSVYLYTAGSLRSAPVEVGCTLLVI